MSSIQSYKRKNRSIREYGPYYLVFCITRHAYEYVYANWTYCIYCSELATRLFGPSSGAVCASCRLTCCWYHVTEIKEDDLECFTTPRYTADGDHAYFCSPCYAEIVGKRGV